MVLGTKVEKEGTLLYLKICEALSGDLSVMNISRARNLLLSDRSLLSNGHVAFNTGTNTSTNV